ncbi:SDR family NAD(P)-dependent oxidoreductase [Asanoa iriomotensis]|uniref:3-oxoacyl-ACP reductase n=1 Tax=Asanoa iriomotensis TaxID=234613 RepID=A0ABQ4BUP3_9ACTN|nr:SDR family NAD(P)-dependent oxidoreductase [Asanoa iriomotensis]GIF54243.1 3-oxoacyl-ACP reductase [Asanoa iriomotensis]
MARILITGASDGLGRALALALASQGHELVLHGRHADRLAEVARATGAVALRADLASPAAVRALAAEVADRCDALDVLVNNAAVGFGAPGAPRELTGEGIELRLAVNYLAPYLLSRLLLPLLRKSARARIVNVASIGQADIDLDDLMMAQEYDGIRAYRRAKLAMICDTFDLAAQLHGTGITANCLHPATLMPTTLVRVAQFAPVSTLEQGLRATLRLVVDPALDEVTGVYFDGEREERVRAQAYDPAFRAALAARAAELTES